MTRADDGPGSLGTEDVGRLTIARTQVLDSRFVMAYAAAISDDNPAYYDDLRAGGPMVHPAICFSLQWASRFRPDMPANPRAAPYGVHASTDLRVHRPFLAGEAITTQGRILQKRQIRPGVFALDRYRMTASDGTLVAELDYNGITRGARLEGPDRSIADTEPLPTLQEAWSRPLWRQEIVVPRYAAQQYTECARIYNPIHTEPSVAKAAGLPDIILHGSATKAMALSVVVNRCFGGDATCVTRLVGELRGMVLLGTTIVVECLAEELVDGLKTVAFRTLTEEGREAIAGGYVVGRVG
jgi:acyl dehydratase